MLINIRQKTISGDAIVSVRYLTHVCVDEKRNIESTAIITPVITFGDAGLREVLSGEVISLK